MATVFVANMIRLKSEGYRPSRDLILALTADEEGGPENGVKWLLANHRDLIDAEFAINEGGGGVMRKGRYVTNEVQAAEKVYQDVRLEVHNSGGHSSMPAKDNAIYRLSAGLSRLAAFEFPVQLSDITRAYFTRSAPAQADAQTRADMLAVARVPPDLAAAARLSAQSTSFNSLLRTTCVATKLEGGHALNALPQLAAANVNCRIFPGESPTEVMAVLTKVVADPAIKLSPVDEATPSKPATLRDDLDERGGDDREVDVPRRPSRSGDEHGCDRWSLSSQRRDSDLRRGRPVRRHRRRARTRPRRACGHQAVQRGPGVSVPPDDRVVEVVSGFLGGRST